MFSSLKSLFGSPAKPSPLPRPCLECEALETRLMPASISLVGTQLRIYGGGSADQIVVNRILTPAPTGRSTAFTIEATVIDARTGAALNRRFNALGVSSILVEANGGDDTVRNNTSLPATLNGGFGNDLLIGGSGKDVIHGDVSPLAPSGPGGVDSIYGRGGGDDLYGDGSADLVVGGSGGDRIYGGGGDDVLVGESGDDTLYGQGGGDDVYGDEVFSLDHPRTDPAMRFLADLIQTASSVTAGVNELHGGSGEDFLYGGRRRDVMYGDSGGDGLYGGGGDDLLDGGAGADWLNAEGGRDTLVGGEGADMLNGGEQADTFYYDLLDFMNFIPAAAYPGNPSVVGSYGTFEYAELPAAADLVFES